MRGRNRSQVSSSSRKSEERRVGDRKRSFKLWRSFFRLLTFPFAVPGPALGSPEPRCWCWGWWWGPAKLNRWLWLPLGAGCPPRTERAGMGSIAGGFLLAELRCSGGKRLSTHLTLACKVKSASSPERGTCHGTVVPVSRCQ